MTTEVRFLTYKPQNPAAPTLAEIRSATLVMGGAFIDITAAFKQAEERAQEAGEAALRLATNYETSFSFTRISGTNRRQQARMNRTWVRIFRAPKSTRRQALIHNGKKPRGGHT